MFEIREATAEDIPTLLEYGNRFVPHLGFPIEADSVSLENTFYQLIDEPNCILLVDEGVKGAIGGIIYPHFFNTRSFVCQEVFWWVSEDERKSGLGGKLIKAFEEKARKKGASRIGMICILNDETSGLDDYYRKLGYRELESTFVKEL